MPFTEQHFTYAYFGSAAFSILLPLLMFWIARGTNNQQGGQNNYNNNNRNGNNYNNFYNQDRCKWWQWGCRDIDYYENGNGGGGNQNRQDGRPWWWLWAEDERRPEDATNPTLVVIYLWSLVLFLALVFVGFRIQKNEAYDNRILSGALMVFANLTIIGMLFLGGLEGAVQADGPEMEENGFYGQFGVLLFTTYFWMTLYSIFVVAVLRLKSKAASTTKIELKEGDYQAYESPEVTVSKNDAV